MGIKYGRGWGGARISLSRDLYSQESTFSLVDNEIDLMWLTFLSQKFGTLIFGDTQIFL